MRNIKLLASGGGSNPQGFHSTREGRLFLRFCYERYIKLTRSRAEGSGKLAHGKVAEQIATQPKDVPAITQALTRWCDHLQADIWSTDIVRSEDVARKIEILLSSETSIAQLLEDRAASIRAEDFVGSLSAFFFPASKPFERALARQSLERHMGVFTVWTYSGDGSRTRDYYYASAVNVALIAHDTLPAAIVHEFTVTPLPQGSAVTGRRSGFAIFGDLGTAVYYLIDYANPAARWIEVHTLDARPTDAPGVSQGDRRYSIKDIAISEDGESGVKAKRASMVSKVGHHDPFSVLIQTADTQVIEVAHKVVRESKWDIML